MTTPTVSQDRSTKYTKAVAKAMAQLGHATNQLLLETLRLQYPNLSATTVHRITTRLVERGELRMAPNTKDACMRFDANTAPHDHFMCDICGMLRDAQLSESVRPAIEQAIGTDCSISGNLTISGVCRQCHTKEKI